MTAVIVHSINLFSVAIPIRRSVAYSTAEGGTVSPIVVAVELRNGIVGYGEIVPHCDVIDGSADPVSATLRDVFLPVLLDLSATSFPEALEAIEALPWRNGANHLVAAERASLELALLDAAMRTFHRGIDDVASWMGLPGFGSPGSVRQVRFSGVLAAASVKSTLRRLRTMYWRGLRTFNLKVGFDGDSARLKRVAAYLRRPLANGRASIRVDAEGSWSKDDAIEWLSDAATVPLAAVEQPLARGQEDDLRVLRDLFTIPIIHDESLVTIEDGRRLIDLGLTDGFNIRIGKCGGLIPSLRLAALARRADVRIQVGCAFGETSILSAAALRLLQVCPGVAWADGRCDQFLPHADFVVKGLRFGYGGRLPLLPGPGLGIDVDPHRLRRSCIDKPVTMSL